MRISPCARSLWAALLVGAMAVPPALCAQTPPSSAALIPLPEVSILVKDRDFTEISPVQKTSAEPGTTEVVVFFAFNSPQSAALAPYIGRWQANQDSAVKIVWQPAVLSDDEGYGARVFFALDLLQRTDLVPDLIAAYAAKKIVYGDSASLSAWLSTREVDPLDFARALDDGRCRAMAAWAPSISQAYRLTSVPAIAIDGHWLVSITDLDPPPLAVAQARYIVAHTRSAAKDQGD